MKQGALNNDTGSSKIKDLKATAEQVEESDADGKQLISEVIHEENITEISEVKISDKSQDKEEGSVDGMELLGDVINEENITEINDYKMTDVLQDKVEEMKEQEFSKGGLQYTYKLFT